MAQTNMGGGGNDDVILRTCRIILLVLTQSEPTLHCACCIVPVIGVELVGMERNCEDVQQHCENHDNVSSASVGVGMRYGA